MGERRKPQSPGAQARISKARPQCRHRGSSRATWPLQLPHTATGSGTGGGSATKPGAGGGGGGGQGSLSGYPGGRPSGGGGSQRPSGGVTGPGAGPGGASIGLRFRLNGPGRALTPSRTANILRP